MAKRDTVSSPWRTPVNLGSRINSNQTDGNPQISDDGLRLFYSSNKSGGFGQEDLYMVTRETVNSTWGNPVNMGPLFNTGGREPSISICPKACTMFICSARSGGVGQCDIWEIPIASILDFDGNGRVGELEINTVVEQWHTDAAECDVAPAPFGDGFVDVQDLLVFSECVSKGVYDPTLVAHWALDETEGDIAYDSAGLNDVVVLGGAIWLPNGGHVDGAIELDGLDDCLIADTPLNPADGPFSVFAWINGGAAGQAIISEPAGPDWLSLDPKTGCLMTELTSAGRGASLLLSQTNINDGNWHRVGFVWDGGFRMLYVDGVVVSSDMQSGLVSPGNGFYIGTGKAMAPGTYFEGLIDDVRIYNRVVRP